MSGTDILKVIVQISAVNTRKLQTLRQHFYSCRVWDVKQRH